MTAEAAPWWPAADGLLIRIRLTPRSQRDAVEGIDATAEGPALKARVRAVPEDGAANRAAERAVADWLGVAKGSVSLVSGAKSRIKTVLVAGDPAALSARAEARLGGAAGQKEGRHG